MATSKKKTKLKTKKAPPRKSVAPAQAKPSTKKSAAKFTLLKTPVSIREFITPLDDRLIVAVHPAPEKTAGGLFIPGGAGERPGRGEVLAAGRGRRNKKGQLRPLDVTIGDQVLFAEFAGSKIKIGDAEFLILREEEVLGIVT